jgi:glycine oxidase
MASFDVLIVGNGAIGHAVAHEVAMQDPNVSIAIVGMQARPLGASTAAGAMLGSFAEVTASLRKSKAGQTKMKEARESAKLWPVWLDRLNESISPADKVTIRPGTFVIHNSIGGLLDTENYEAIRTTLVECREEFEDVDPKDIVGLKPWDMARPLRAMYLPGEGVVESDRLLAAYVASARTSKSITVIDDHVTAVAISKDSVTGVNTASGKYIEAKKVVLAAGVSTQQLLDGIPSLKYRIPRLFSGGGTSIVVDPEWCFGDKKATIGPHAVRTPNRSFACGLHMLPRGSSHVYIGATNYISMRPWDRPNLSDMHFLIDCAVEQLNQNLVWSQLVRWNSGNRPVTIDGNPIVGATSVEGLWIISGTFRDGLHMSPLLAKQVGKELLHGEQSTSPAFRPERPPVTMSKDEAIAEILVHYQASWSEHRIVNSTKIGMHYALPSWVATTAAKTYEELDSPYVLPPEFFPLVDGNPANLNFFRQYYSAVEKEWA